MDPLSQAVLGGMAAVLACPKKKWVRPAVFAGIGGGLLPDADILIRSNSDPLLAVEMHRHFTHSLAFVPVGGLICAALLSPFLLRYFSFLWLYLFATVGYATHGILDSMTSYGTHLFWPFTQARESWAFISIIDPLFTLTLLLLLIVSVVKRYRRACMLALCFALFYWSVGLIQQGRALEQAMLAAKGRGHEVQRAIAKPSFGNILLWRTMYQTDARIYADAVRLGWGENIRWIDGESVAALDKQAYLGSIPEGSILYDDIVQFDFFSDGWTAVYEMGQEGETIADMRFAYLPHSLKPLWGISFDPQQTEQHVRFHNLNRRSSADWRQFRTMLLGG